METKSFAIGLVIGIVVAVVLATFLYMNYTNKTQLLEQEKSNIESQLTTCQSNLDQCRNQVNTLTQKVEQLQSTLQQLQQEKSKLETSLQNLETVKQSLEKQVEELKAKGSELEASLKTCVSEKESLAKNLEAVKSSLQACEADKKKLESEITGLKEQVKSLEDEKSRLESQVNWLENKNKMLTQQLEDANKQIEYLNSQIEQLSTNIEELNKRLKEAYNEYNKLINTIIYADMWFGWYTNETELYKFYDNILGASINEVKRLVDLAGFSGEAGFRGFDVFEKTVLWLSYYPDNYVRYPLFNNTIGVRDDVLMLPNETWEKGGGDCEDLALFVYAILKATQRPSEQIYMVTWISESGDAHTGVLLVYKHEGKKMYYVIDPAGNYFNGVSVYLNLSVISINGAEYYVYLSPLEISYGHKEFLVNNGFATIIYYDIDYDNFTYNPPIYYYEDAFNALRDWIIRYWGITNLKQVEIHDIGVHKVFETITDLAKWLEEQ